MIQPQEANVRVEGTVRSWKEPWGWISVPHLGNDLFVHNEDLVSGTLHLGATVTCEVGPDAKSGRPRALRVEAKSVVPQKAVEEGGGPRLEGLVDSWKEPWGWISGPSLEVNVFAHRKDVEGPLAGGIRKGSPVSFEVGSDEKTGKPRALHVWVLEEGGAAACGSETARLRGTVESWKEPWGWVTCPQLEGGLFAHRSNLVCADPFLVPIAVGAPVSFEEGLDAKSGRRRALRIELLDGAAPPQRRRGMVVSWKDMWGWIACPELPDGGELFAHQREVAPGTWVGVGVAVTFEVGADDQGRRRAQRIVPVDGKGYTGKGVDSKGFGGKACGKASDALGFGGNDWSGKGFMGKGFDAKGYDGKGFDGRGFGGNVFQGLGMGYDGSGKGFSSIGFGSASCSGKGAGKDVAMKGAGKGYPVASGPTAFVGQTLTGTFASWKEQWGWISCPMFMGDIFAHSEDLKGTDGAVPFVGQTANFTVGTDNKGRIRALQIRPSGADAGRRKRKAAEAASESEARRGEYEEFDGRVLEGEVRSWRDPWGWIAVPGFECDVFAHKENVVSGGELAVGQAVLFFVGRDPKSGRWRATQIQDGGSPPGQALSQESLAAKRTRL